MSHDDVADGGEPNREAVTRPTTAMDREAELARRERALSRDERRFRALADAAQDAIVAADAAGRITFWNGAAERMFGHAAADVLGRALSLVVPERLRAAHEAGMARYAATRVARLVGHTVEVPGLRADGTEFPLELSLGVWEDDDGPAFTAVLRDVSERARSAAAREQERGFLAAVLEGVADGVVACDAAGRLTLFNRATREWHGLPEADVPPERWADHYALYDADGVTPLPMERVPLFRALQGEEVRDVEIVIAPNGGARRRVVCNGRRLRTPDGHAAGAVVTMSDVTAREATLDALRRSETRFRAIFDHSGVGALLVDRRGNVVEANNAFAAFIGHDVASLRGRRAVDLILPEDREVTSDPAREVHAGRVDTAACELRFVRQDGAVRWATLMLSRVTLGDGTYGTLGKVQDVTDRKAAESALARALRDERAARAEAEQARAEAEEASRAKSDFLARMSHELRTPLNSVIGFSRILAANPRGTRAEKDVLFAERIRANGEHLLALINEILDLSKIEARRMTVERAPVDLAALVGDTVAELEGRVLGTPVALAVEAPAGLPPLATDAARLKQVLINLVGNSIKFTPAGRVTVAVLAGPDGRARAIEVRDTGVGIPADRLEAIFESFVQGERSTQYTHGGTGLGLAISRALCELLGYRLEARSVVGAGSTFTVRLAAH